MHILLAAATAAEIQPTVEFLPKSRHRHSTLITGVGAVPTVWSLMRQIDRDRPDLIIQAGIAGSFRGRPAGSVVAIRAESFADLGVWEDERFQTVFDLRLADPDGAPFSGGKLVNPYKRLLDLTGLEVVNGITVNEISTGKGRIQWLERNSGAAVESMEGAALHYTGLQEGIAFLQLRSVSNEIGVRDKAHWNIALAIAGLNDQLIRLLRQLDAHDNSLLCAVNDPI